MIRNVIALALFVFLLSRGFQYINSSNLPQMKYYQAGFNEVLHQLEQVQKILFGQIKVPILVDNLRNGFTLSAIASNIGGIYILSSAAALANSTLISGISVICLSGLTLLFQTPHLQQSQNDLLEKYQHLILGSLIFIWALSESKNYKQKDVDRALKIQYESLCAVNEIKQSHLEQVNEKSKKIKKQQQQQQQQQEEDERKAKEQSEQLLSNQQQQKQTPQGAEEEEEEERSEEQAISEQAKQKQQQQEQEEEEQIEEKRKYKLDEDGFAIIPKKNPKKVQQQKVAAKKAKKEHYDI